MKHLLDIESLPKEAIVEILKLGDEMKKNRSTGRYAGRLQGQVWAMIFSKSSTRTRVSFEVGVRELGGQIMFLSANDIQLGRGEPIKDTARVLGRMIHGAIIRTYDQKDVVDFARYSGIPTINALTDAEHPCQILADLMTFTELRGNIEGKTVTFAGDGACNVALSWLFAAAKLGFELRIAAPRPFQPPKELLERLGGRIVCTENLVEAAEGSHLIYTDVWVSMGKEGEAKERLELLNGFQVNEEIVNRASRDVLVMHCLPAYRGKEIDEPTLERHSETIFTQAENRLHAQKGVLAWLTDSKSASA